MRKSTLLVSMASVCLLAMFSLTVQSQALPELLYYKFDIPGATVINHATAPVGTNPAPIAGTGMSIGGTGLLGTNALVGTGGSSSSDYVNTGWATSLSGSFTIAFWTSNITPSSTLWYIWGDNTASSFRCFTNGVAGANNWMVRGGGFPDVEITGGATTAANMCHFVYDATLGEARAYVDAVLVNTVSVSGTINISGSNFKIGGYSSSSGLSGNMDEYRIYNRALTQTEITNTYDISLGATLAADAGAWQITSPVSPISPGSYPVKVDIRNYGTDTLTSATIGWEVNGTTQSTYSWTGSLAQNDVDTGIVLGSFNFPLGTHEIKAWTTAPNGLVDSAAYNDTTVSSVICAQVLNGIYTIGGVNPDYATIGLALNDLNAAGVSGPVTFMIAPGTYNEQMTINEVLGGSQTNRVTFQSSTGNASDVIIKHNASSSGNWTLFLDGADFISLQNLSFVADDSTYARVIYINNGADYNIIDGCEIISQPMARGNSNSAGIYDDSGNDNFNVISNNNIYNGYYGVRSYGSSTSSLQEGTVFENNTVEDFYYYGVYFYYHLAPMLNENTVLGHSSSTTNYGLACSYCDEQLEMKKNEVNIQGSGTQYAFRVYRCDATDSTMGVIANNMASVTGATGSTCYGGYFYYNYYQKYYNNSFHVATGSSSSRGAYIYQGGSNNSVNNIFLNTGGGYSVYVYGSPLFISDHNNYFTTGSNFAYWGSAVSDLLALQTASGQDANSVSIDPVFTAPDFLYPGSTTMDNLGTPLTDVTDDILGNVRSSTTPDMGCIEYTPPQDDAGIVSIDSPTNPQGPGTHTISATIKNYGLVNLSTCNLNFSVNGGPTTSQLWLGNLSPGGTDGPTVIGSFNFPLGTHQIKVWTSDPNLQTDGNALNDTMVMTLNVCQVLNSTYTIGDSALGADYYSFNDAIAAMTNCGIGGTVVFNVLSDTYTEQVSIPEIPGASLMNRVIFQSATGNAADVVLKYAPSSSSASHVWLFNGADYIDLQNITIKVDSGASYGRAVYFDNSSNYNSVIGCTIENLDVTSSYYAGIYSSSSQDEFNVISDNTILNGYYGIYFYGPSSSTLETGNIFENNVVEGFYYYGMYLYYQNAHIVNANQLHNSPNSNYCYGIRNYYCDGPIQITKNQIHLDGSGYNYGMYVYYCDADPQTRGLIANNWIMQDIASNSGAYGMYVYNSSYQDFYNNSINLITTAATSRCLYLSGSSLTDISFVNNIFSNFGFGTAIYLGSSSYLSGIGWMDYNNLYTNGSSVAYASGSYSTLADWTAFSGTDSNSVSADPSYLSTSYLLPAAPAMDNMGTPLSQVSDDILGNPRSLTTPDIGAAEFTPPQTDMAIIDWVTPMGSACGLSQNEVISVSLYNNGLSSASNIQVTYSIDGGATFVTPEYVAGTMMSGDTLLFTFNQTADMSTYGMYNGVAAVYIAGDANAINDTIFLTVENIQPLDSFPHTQNFETFIPGSPGTFMDNWIADPSTGFRWQVNTGSTGSTNTGASGDHTTGSGVYVYTEASSGSSGDVATLTSKCLDMSSMTAPELRFWYHMWGPDHNHFAVDALVGGVWQTDVFTINGQTHSSATDPWLEAVVPLVNYSSADKIRFRVLRGGSFGGDVCIDDVKIQEAPQFEVELIEFLGPDGGCDLGIDDVTIRVTNNGAMSIAGNLAATYWITGAANPVVDTITTTINPGDTLDYIFTVPIDLTVTTDSVFEITGYVYLSNDSDPSNDTAYHTVSSSVSPAPPMVANVTINTGDSATLSIINPDSNNSYYWYDSLVGGNELAVNDTYITPPLQQTTVYYASTKAGSVSPVIITEFNSGSPDVVEVMNTTNSVQDLTGWKVAVSDAYGAINTVNSITQDLGIMQPNEVRHWTDGTVNDWGNNLLFSVSQEMWACIIDPTGQIADVLFMGYTAAQIAGFTGPINGFTLSVGNEWLGDGVDNTGNDAIIRMTYDNNDATDWVAGGTGSPGLLNPGIAFVGGGSSNGCESVRVPDTVFVVQPVVVVNAGNDTSICLGDSMQMNLNVTGGQTPYTYSWSPAGSLNDPSIANPMATPITNTTYSVTVSDQNGDSGSDDIIVLVNPGPNVNLGNIPDICINYPSYTLIEGTPVGGAYSGPGVSGGVFNPTVAGVGTHTITYTYTDPVTGCTGSESNTILVDLCIGLEDMESGIGMSVHPNPTSGQVMVSLYSEESDILLSLIDVTGKLIREERILNTQGLMTHELDLSKLPQGVYYIRLQGGDKSTAAKVVKH